jgi:hypothetical protein
MAQLSADMTPEQLAEEYAELARWARVCRGGDR